MLRNVLREVPGVTVVGVARNGLEALQKIEELNPNLITLDVEMPELNGIDTLREINKRHLSAQAIMVSNLTAKGAQATTDALLEGALDFILKPNNSDHSSNRQQLFEDLQAKIRAFQQSLCRISHTNSPHKDEEESHQDYANSQDDTDTNAIRCRAVILGTSTGGPASLKVILPKLPETFPVPILVVQHMPATYTQSLAKRLNEMCALRVTEAQEGEEFFPGNVYIAPGGFHLKVVRENSQLKAGITEDAPENGCRPAVDYLLRHVAEALEGEALAVILTGMGRDGLEGAKLLKAKGGHIFAQQAMGCTVYGMPKAVTDAGLASRILPLASIAPAIIRHVKRARRAQS